MLKVLLVDDDSKVRERIKSLIKWEDLNMKVVGSCDNAFTALEIMTDEKVDILLTDIKMPIMDGIELVSKAIDMYPAIQCILLSGYDEFSLAQEAMKQGIRHYLLKPCSKGELEQVLHECSERVTLEIAGVLYRFDKRKQVVAQIVDALHGLKLNKSGRIELSEIKEIAHAYYDLSLLQEALTQIITQNSSVLNPRETLDKMSKFYYDEEGLYSYIAEILTEIDHKADDSTVIEDIKTYINANYDNQNLTLQYIADNVVFMNPQYLGKLFQKQTGQKFSEYTMKTRIDKAIELLLGNNDLKMFEIAEYVGLGQSVQYFYQMFKKHTGLTPKEYQEKRDHE